MSFYDTSIKFWKCNVTNYIYDTSYWAKSIFNTYFIYIRIYIDLIIKYINRFDRHCFTVSFHKTKCFVLFQAMGLKIVDELLNKSFYRLGFLVGRHPGYFLIVPTLLTMFFVTGYQRIHTNIDPEYLFSPINGEGKYERAVVEGYFKLNYSNQFNVARITRAGKFHSLLI